MNVELTVGRAQLALLRRTFAAASGLRRGLVDAAGHRLAYLDRRRGEPLLCVHGFGGDKETWLMMAPLLPRRLRTLLVDLPGHGASTPITGEGAGARAQAAVLAAFLDALGIERAVVVGNSMGGGIALRFARDYPSRTRALVLVASAAPVWIENELTAALARGENLLVPDSHEKTEAFLRSVTERPLMVPRALQRYVTTERIRRQAELDAIFAGWSAAKDMPEDLEAITAPTLVIHGARDKIIHPRTADVLAARLPRARRVILDRIGHVPQLEDPRRVAALIAAFLARV